MSSSVSSGFRVAGKVRLKELKSPSSDEGVDCAVELQNISNEGVGSE